jgi:serine protease Do
VRHAQLGVSMQEVNQAFAESFKLDKPEGALISSVSKGSPAEKAGLQSRRRDPPGGRPAHHCLG